MRRLLLVTWLAALSFAGAASATHDKNDLCPVTVCKTTSPTQMLQLHNWARGHHALPQPLNKMPALYSAAGVKADRVLQCGVFTHFPCGDGFRCAEQLTACGENLAYGFPTVRAAFSALMHSPGHRNNILGAWTWYGSGYRANGILPRLWVFVFGSSSGTSVLGASLPGPLACAVMCVKPTKATGGR